METHRADRSVLRALAILDALGASEEGMLLTELAADVGYPVSTTHRLLETLASQGYVEREAQSGRYVLGSKILRLQAASANRINLARTAFPHLRELARQLDESVRWCASSSLWCSSSSRGSGWFVGVRRSAHVVRRLSRWFAAWFAEAYQEPAGLAPAFECAAFDARSDGTFVDAELVRCGGDIDPLWHAARSQWFAGWYAGWIRWYVAWYVGGSPVHGTHGTPKKSRPEPWAGSGLRH